jgi:hypothetical protein
VPINGGQITIQFSTGTADQPMINAIEITQSSGVAVQVNPNSASLTASQSQQFAATVTGTTNTAVTWSMNPSVGTLSTSGLYTAPASITSTQTVSITATSVADPTKFATATVTLMPTGGSFAPIRVHAGGGAYTDPLGQVWSADYGFSGGSTYSVTNPISNTNTPTLYQSQRYGSGFSYQFTVPNGTYTVNLKFAELYYTSTGNRVFNVAINGSTVLSNFDVVAQAGGGFRAVDKPFTVPINGGQITIQFSTGTADLPIINAIEIK